MRERYPPRSAPLRSSTLALVLGLAACSPAADPPPAPGPALPGAAPAAGPADTLRLPPLHTILPRPADLVTVPARRDIVPAILPHRRVVAYYGNPRSRRMGILGEVPPDQMLARLDREVAAWQRADPATPVQPALHLIAVVAAADPGADGKYRNRMPASVVEEVLAWAERRDAIVFLDIQPGFSTYEEEFERLRRWFELPHVHLGIDPEFDMPAGHPPGTRIGTTDAAQINRLIGILAEIVEEHDLPPKILVVHRFTRRMVTNADRIELDPRVQVVMHMDGWGPPYQKRATYEQIVAPEAVQFTGFKIFYHNDTRGGSRLMTPQEILELDPVPVYIQYH